MGIQFGKEFGGFSKSTKLSQDPAISFLSYLIKKKEIICLHKHMFIAALYVIVPRPPAKKKPLETTSLSYPDNEILLYMSQMNLKKLCK